MKIDDDVVLVGERVWHTRYGYGTVVAVHGGTCDVRFDGAHDVVTFTDGGLKNGLRVLYWQEPIVIALRKGVDYSGLPEMIHHLLNFKYGDVNG